MSGNDAAHGFAGSPGEALSALKFCRALGVWYRRSYGRDPNFAPGPFIPPRSKPDIDQATLSEIEDLRRQVREAEAKRALALVGKLDEAILAKAFRGELVPQNENDEPAEKLLERIRVEREATPKAKRGRK